MHTTTCESFLEARATACDGVVDAEASYVTETIRVVHDPDCLSQTTLCERLSTVGYTAVPRSAAPIDSSAAAARGDRHLDDLLGYRYAAGVLFGSFLLLTYVVLAYPAHLSALLGEGRLTMFEDAFRFDEGGAVLVVPLFLGLTGVVLFFTGLPLLRDAYVSIRTRQPTTELLTVITIGTAFLYSPIAMILGRTDVYFDLTVVIASVVVAAIFYASLVKRHITGRKRTAVPAGRDDDDRSRRGVGGWRPDSRPRR
jgi:cation transport ATPase